MARQASLKPVEKTVRGHTYFVVNLPRSLTGTGKRQRRYFDAEKEAKEFCKQERIRLVNFGTASRSLPAGKIEEAAAAFEKLEGAGISLLEAVDQALERKRARENSITFKTIFDRFMHAKQNLSAPYLRELRYTLARFAALQESLMCDITAEQIEEHLSGASASVHNAALRDLRAVFNFGLKKGWCTENPVKRIDMQPVSERTEALTNEQVSALLRACKSDFELLPYHLFTIFAGIRPEGEMSRLTWDNVNMDEHYIEVPKGQGKDKKKRRIIEMEPLLVRWLDYYVRNGGSTVGKVTPTRNFRKRLRNVRKAARVDWRELQDAPRRTYASNWLAVHANETRLALYMGHTSPKMLWERYHKAVTRKQADAFWEIEPPPVSSKIIRLASA